MKTRACCSSAALNAVMSPTRTAAGEGRVSNQFPALPRTAPARLTLRDLEVRPQRLAKHRFPKDLSLRNLAHEQAHEDEELVRVLEEARRGGEVRGPAADRLQERGVRGRVVELDRADPA